VALLTGVGVCLLGLPLGLLFCCAILAPTDPVLASDVQVEHPFDSKPLRFSRTGAARWNDGTAFPFVMLGLGLFGAHHMAWGVALGRR
jgi:NhaP-type Na+/H+ or K+/H+ antiporter